MQYTYSGEKVSDMGPLEDDKEEIRQEPFTLPSNFTWDDICLEDEEQVIVLSKLIIMPLSLSFLLPAVRTVPTPLRELCGG